MRKHAGGSVGDEDYTPEELARAAIEREKRRPHVHGPEGNCDYECMVEAQEASLHKYVCSNRNVGCVETIKDDNLFCQFKCGHFAPWPEYARIHRLNDRYLNVIEGPIND